MLIDVLAPKVMPVPLSPRVTAPPAVKPPAKVITLGAVTLTLLPNVKASAAALPNTKLPVLRNSTALVMLLVDPVKLTL